MLRHGIRTGQYGCHVAQKRQKASNENEPAAISHKEPLTDSDPSFGDSETRPVSHQQLVAESPADPKADNLAEDCCDDSSSDQNQISRPCVLAAKKPAAIKAASAGNGMPTLSSATNAATTQMP